MLTDKDYLQIISEVYNISGYQNRKQLIFCNEAEKNQKIENIVTGLYKYIVQNITDIDFGNIPASKGVIDKVENYEKMVTCLNTIQDLVASYKDPTNTVKEIYNAIDNIKNRERLFSKAFALNIELPIMIYNITVLSIISSVSLLIASSIEYIKNGHQSFKIAFDKAGYKRTKDHLTFKYIQMFNNNCKNGSIDKLMDGCIKNNLISTKEAALSEVNWDTISSSVKDAASGGVGATVLKWGMLAPTPIKIAALVVGVGMSAWTIFKMIGKLILLFIKMRIQLSDWFALQAELLNANAENLRYREDEYGDEHKNNVYQKQLKWANRFKEISNFLLIKDSKANVEVENEKLITPSEVDDNQPSGGSRLF